MYRVSLWYKYWYVRCELPNCFLTPRTPNAISRRYRLHNRYHQFFTDRLPTYSFSLFSFLSHSRQCNILLPTAASNPCFFATTTAQTSHANQLSIIHSTNVKCCVFLGILFAFVSLLFFVQLFRCIRNHRRNSLFAKSFFARQPDLFATCCAVRNTLQHTSESFFPFTPSDY